MNALDDTLEPFRTRLALHPIYDRLESEAAIRCFMSHHVFAVWDFMTLVKSLARRLTCVETPWVPVGDPVERRFINEIVLDEESDLDEQGRPTSHFELYRTAMVAAGADTAAIDGFVAALRDGARVDAALVSCGAPAFVGDFVGTTLSLAGASDVEQAAAFAHGRELVIPAMFREVVARLGDRDAERWRPFAYYLERHVACDDEKHGPIARRLVARLCADESGRWALAERAARRALQARLALWDGVLGAIEAEAWSPTSAPASAVRRADLR